METTYRFDDNQLVILDRELNIAIDEPFSPRLLPSFKELSNTDGVVVEKSDASQELSAGFRTEEGYHGQWRSFTLKGELQAECYYLKGVLHGPSLFYSLSGQCLSRSWFYRGLQHGRVMRYYRSGDLSSLERYFKGKREGKQLYYYCDGKPKTEMGYQQGQLEGEAHLFWANGKKKRSCAFIKGEREGFDRIWNGAGLLIDEGEYNGGNPIGRHRCWHDNGALRSLRSYHTLERFDAFEWDAESELVFEAVFDETLNYVEKKWEEGEWKVRSGKWVKQGIEWE